MVHGQFYFSSLAPTVTPRDVQTIRLNGTHTRISWELPTLLEARGFIDSITITFTPILESQHKNSQVVTVNVLGNTTSALIGGLDPDLQYFVAISISTIAGAGPEANTVVPSK